MDGQQVRFATDPHYRTGLWDDAEDEDSDGEAWQRALDPFR
ncbi:hypothetical protein [Thiorhodococcus mannitoliphagus]|nr:hypothetical protein [Thiorhodococcus mannitoliphagus]